MKVIQQALNIIINAGVAGTCNKLCADVANATKSKSFTVTKALLSKQEIDAVLALAAKLDDADLAKNLKRGYAK